MLLLCIQAVNIMRIYDLLTHSERSELTKLKCRESNRKRSRRNSERLNERDMKELMNTNIQRYKRVHGRVKRK